MHEPEELTKAWYSAGGSEADFEGYSRFVKAVAKLDPPPKPPTDRPIANLRSAFGDHGQTAPPQAYPESWNH